jgi:hypothetical protein
MTYDVYMIGLPIGKVHLSLGCIIKHLEECKGHKEVLPRTCFSIFVLDLLRIAVLLMGMIIFGILVAYFWPCIRSKCYRSLF